MSLHGQSWHSAISFSDRFATVAKIKAALVSSNSCGNSQAQTQAREAERQFFEQALTKDEYEEQCAHFVEILPASAAAESVQDVKEPPLSPSAVTIGEYRHAHHHADGLFSHVFKAKNPHVPSPEYVALKVTVPSTMVPPHDSEKEARILREAANTNVVSLLDTFQLAGGRFVLVFDFMPLDLGTLLDSGRANQSQAKSHLRDLFSALSFLHSKGIIHRDVKPSNVLLKSAQGPAVLADFGIAWMPTDPASEPAEAKITDVGTTCYRPPELLFGDREYTQSLDLWAAGCVVAEVAGLGSKTLFDAGDLGSELALIQSIFKSLGTPTLETWPGAARLPDWGKMLFKEFPPTPWQTLLPRVPHDALDLVEQLVRYESRDRLGAARVLEHRYLETNPSSLPT